MAQLNATTYGEHIKNEITDGIKITDTLDLVNFDKSPKLTFLDDVSSIYPDEAIGQNVYFLVSFPIRTCAYQCSLQLPS